MAVLAAAPVGGPDLDNAVAVGNIAVSRSIPVVAALKGANGSVALAALVCVIGITAGAIRAILAQRASRARAA